ncbi:MAG TPA: hypothetical protein DCE41_24505 [Cytophagales bacterium]|nr:hypothetical protein [Cytophagales bacterium]HAA21454.1 hypothetical protein [Cytophagales bacterium]HAP65237.1 hypothetical protein [Cytophagales bacterium]
MRYIQTLAAVVLCTACAKQVASNTDTTGNEPETPSPTTQVSLVGRWELVGYQDPSNRTMEVVPKEFDPPYVMTISSEESVLIFGPLNRLTADLLASRDDLRFENVLVTEMGSTNTDLVNYEEELYGLINGSVSYEIREYQLIFFFYGKKNVVWKWAPE